MITSRVSKCLNTADNCINWYNLLLENNLALPFKDEIFNIFNVPEIIPPVIYFQKLAHMHQKACAKLFPAALFLTTKIYKQVQWPVPGKWITYLPYAGWGKSRFSLYLNFLRNLPSVLHNSLCQFTFLPTLWNASIISKLASFCYLLSFLIIVILTGRRWHLFIFKTTKHILDPV